ncbi:hypothetical protein MSG28_003742 [Choristoneura fumiferana]|uniref:Uncharacterized protein n=1 Tax=Choristoneura fumiferana TaxID=7141 RepID=A0ACC0KGT1_CHOFU|nr:hypothetical protein MSG28_003742 [Choristoneura fumiferana]
MLVRGRGCCKMPCESCAVQFSVFRRKRACSECERFYCSACLRRGGGAMCAPCRALSTRPLQRVAIVHLKVRDLQCFLQRQNVSTRGCVEKEELVTLCVAHVNSAAYRRRAPRAPFPSLKGFTTNINVFLSSAFDLRASPPPAPPAPRSYPPHPQPDASRGGCVNAAHAHAPHRERFSATPGGEERITVPLPTGGAGGAAEAAGGAHVDTADCFEVEDLDDAGWEFVRRPAEPLPNDSEVLLAASEGSLPASPLRASSSLELRSASSRAASAEPDSASLQDEPVLPRAAPAPAPRPHPPPPPPSHRHPPPTMT